MSGKRCLGLNGVKCLRYPSKGQNYCAVHRQAAEAAAVGVSPSSIRSVNNLRSTTECSQQPCKIPALKGDTVCVRHKQQQDSLEEQQEKQSLLSRTLEYDSAIGTQPVDGKTLSEEIEAMSGVRLRDEQVEMTQSIIGELQVNDRAQIRAACGMGKTLVQEATIMEYDRRLSESEDRSGLYVVMVPSISLAQQMKGNYLDHGVVDLQEDSVFSLHHDPDDAKSEPVNEAALEEFLNRPGDSPRVIMVVNSDTSVQKLINAQKSTGVEVDMVVFDEAHKYTVSPEDSSIRATLFNSEDNCTLNSKTRVFMTATPVARPDDGSRYLQKMTPAESVSAYLSVARDKDPDSRERKIGAMRIDQSDTYAFGNMVSDYSLRQAVDKGYLVKPRPYASAVTLRNPTGRPTTRKSRVDHSGTVVDGPGSMSVGSYQNVSAMYDYLSSDAAFADKGRSNTLSFANSIKECEDISSNWKSVGMALAQSHVPGMTMDQAREHAYDETSPNRKAARMMLLSEHASVISSSSNDTPAQRQAAKTHFDIGGERTDADGRLKDCSCGQPGRWCPCARVVSNVNIFSEGVDISSIDTIVSDRPKISSESMIVQAVGRASRRFVSPTGRVKEHGNVVIPATYDNTSDDMVNSEEFSVTMGTVDKMWSDRGTEKYRAGKGSDHTLNVRSETLPQDGPADAFTTSNYHEWYMTEGINSGSLSERVAGARLIDSAFKAVAADHKREHGGKPAGDFSQEYVQVMERVRAGAQSSKPRRGRQLDNVELLRSISNGMTESRMIKIREAAKLGGAPTRNKQFVLEGDSDSTGQIREASNLESMIRQKGSTQAAVKLMSDIGLLT